MSMALKVVPRCPEPARLTMASALARHMSASSPTRAWSSSFAARTRSNSATGIRWMGTMSVLAVGRLEDGRQPRLSGADQFLGQLPVVGMVDVEALVALG